MNNQSILEQLGRREGTDKADHGYLPYYERHIGHPKTLLEIGVANGASLRMWQSWLLGWETRVMGVDITYRDLPGLEVHVGDATKPETYEGWLPDTLDVVIDDGSHNAQDILRTLEILWPRVKLGGWYVIEDLATCWVYSYGGDPRTGGPVMERLRVLLDVTLRAGVVSEFHAYNQIVFLRKTEY